MACQALPLRYIASIKRTKARGQSFIKEDATRALYFSQDV